ncbi:MAG: trigger factor [Bacteroidota bacterium]
MNVTLENTAANHGFIKVKIEPSDYQPELEKKLKEYRREARIKGFRPGKVPMGMIKKMYGKELKVNIVLDTASKSLNDYLKEQEDLRIVGDVLPQEESFKKVDWKFDEEFEFVYELGIAPDFDFKPADISIIKHNIEVKDEEVNDRIEALRKQLGETNNPESIEEVAHTLVYGEFKLEAEDEEGETFDLPLDDINAALAEKFVGKKAEETVTFTLTEIHDDQEKLLEIIDRKEEALEALAGEGTFTIKGIVHSVPAEVDQDFFDKVLGYREPAAEEENEEEEFDEFEEVKDEVEGEEASTEENEGEESEEEKEEAQERVTNEADFRAKVKSDIAEAYENEVKEIMGQRLQDLVAEKTEIDLPDEFLKRWLLSTSDEENPITEEQVEKEYPFFRERLKWSLISNQIAKDEELKVEYQDMLETAKGIVDKQFRQMGMSLAQLGDDLANNFADEYLKRDNGKNVQEVVSQAVQTKTMNWLLDNVTVEEQTVTLEEFQDFMKAENERLEARFNTKEESKEEATEMVAE